MFRRELLMSCKPLLSEFTHCRLQLSSFPQVPTDGCGILVPWGLGGCTPRVSCEGESSSRALSRPCAGAVTCPHDPRVDSPVTPVRVPCPECGQSSCHCKYHTPRQQLAASRRGTHWRASPVRGAGGRRGRRGRGGGAGPRRARVTLTMAGNGTAGAPRLCLVRKVPTFDGYGFNLHAEKGKPGQYIGKVDEGSPAETAGLKRGDRILEVNGAPIAGESHKQVVARIKERADEAELLVAAPAPGDALPDLEAPATPAPPEAPAAPAPALNLHMTAAEMRAQLAAKKKVDPKKVPMDLKSKFDIVKKL